MAAHICDYPKKHLTVYFKWVSCVVRELYLDKSGKVGREGEERIEGGRRKGEERRKGKSVCQESPQVQNIKSFQGHC